MHSANTKLHQLLSPMPYPGHFIFSYIKEEKTEIEREHPRLKLIKKSALQQIGLKHVSVLFAKVTLVLFLFCFVFISLINVPAKIVDAFPHFKSLWLPRASAQNTRGHSVSTHVARQQNFG